MDEQPEAIAAKGRLSEAETARSAGPSGFATEPRVELMAVQKVPLVQKGDDLAALIGDRLARMELSLADGDVVVVSSKIVSRAEGRFVDLATVAVSEEARVVAEEIGKDPRLIEVVLRESIAVSRKAKGVLIVRHKLGFVSANAGVDCSNSVPANAPPGSGPWALLLPEAPDASAEALRASLSDRFGAQVGVILSDSFGRPFRFGTVGVAIGLAGLPALWDQRGGKDLFGRVLESTITAFADQIAAAADLVAGQAAEGTPVVVVRGLTFPVGEHAATELCRPKEGDLYA